MLLYSILLTYPTECNLAESFAPMISSSIVPTPRQVNCQFAQTIDIPLIYSTGSPRLLAPDGAIGALCTNDSEFVTCLRPNPSIRAPPPSGEVRVHADGRLGPHDPTRAPQFYDPERPHFAVFPTFPTSDKHPYYKDQVMWRDVSDADMNWAAGKVIGLGLLSHPLLHKLNWSVNGVLGRADDYIHAQREQGGGDSKMVKFLQSRIPRLKRFLNRLESVANDRMTTQVTLVGLQLLFFDISAGLDYVSTYQRIARGDTAVTTDGLPRVIGCYTNDLQVVEMFFDCPNVPVFFIRSLAHFNNQKVLKVVPLVPFKGGPLASPPYPTIFSGNADDHRKHHAYVHFLAGFLTYTRSPFAFKTQHSHALPPAAHVVAPPAASSSAISSAPPAPIAGQKRKRTAKAKPSSGKFYVSFLYGCVLSSCM